MRLPFGHLHALPHLKLSNFKKSHLSFLSYLNTVVTRRDPAALDLDVVGRVRELAVPVRSGALLALVLAAHLQLEPPGIRYFNCESIQNAVYLLAKHTLSPSGSATWPR